MAKSTDHYAKALEHADYAEEVLRNAWEGGRDNKLAPHEAATAAAYAATGQLHAMLAQVTLAYEEHAVGREEWVWVHPDGREFSSAEDAEAAGAVYVDYQHPDGTQEDDALVLEGAPLVDEERTVPANDYARALAAQL